MPFFFLLALEDSELWSVLTLGFFFAFLPGAGVPVCTCALPAGPPLTSLICVCPSAGFSTGGNGAVLAGPTAFSPKLSPLVAGAALPVPSLAGGAAEAGG